MLAKFDKGCICENSFGQSLQCRVDGKNAIFLGEGLHDLVAFSFFTFLRGGGAKGEGKSNVLGIPLFLFPFLAFLLEVPKGTLNLAKIEGKGKAS